MVGLWFLVPAIGVRIPDRQQNKKHKAKLFVTIFGSLTGTRTEERQSPEATAEDHDEWRSRECDILQDKIM